MYKNKCEVLYLMKKWISRICFLFATIFAIIIIILLFKYQNEDMALRNLKAYIEENEDTDNKENKIATTEIDNGEVIQKRYSKIYETNKDFIGWLKIDGTVIDYPVMWTPYDEQKYINRSFDGEYSGSGSIFASVNSNFQPESDNIILYGHHLNYTSMFSELDKYESQEYFEKHKYIQFDTLYQNATYEVVFAGRTRVYPDDYQGFVYWKFNQAKNEDEFNEYVEQMKSISSIVNDDVDVAYGDKLLTLSTCAYHVKNGRFVVVAKKIQSEAVK